MSNSEEIVHLGETTMSRVLREWDEWAKSPTSETLTIYFDLERQTEQLPEIPLD